MAKQIIAPSRGAASTESTTSTNLVELWANSDFATGHLKSIGVLLDMLGEQCEWSYSDAGASERAQERIIHLSRAIRNELDDAIEITTGLTTALQERAHG